MLNQTHDPSELERQERWNRKPAHIPHEGISFEGDPGRTDPTHAKDADINNIIATYHKTGFFPTPQAELAYADLFDAPTRQDAFQTVINAESAFMALDANTRKRFDNDPRQFLDFIDDPRNGAELVKMGLATPRAPTPSEAGPEARGGQPQASQKVPKAPSTPKEEPKGD